MATLRPGPDQWFPSSRLGERVLLLSACALQGDRLLAEGPVAPCPFASLQTHHKEHPANFGRFDPPSAYLELNSVSLQPLLGSLFNNSLFAQ